MTLALKALLMIEVVTVKRLPLMAIQALLLCVGVAWAGPLEDGMAALEHGD